MTYRLSAHRLFVFVASLLAIFSLGACVDQDKEDMLASMREFEDALRNSDGKKAIQYVSQDTFDHYTYMIQYARTFKGEQLNKLSPYQLYHVLGVRAELKPEEVKTFDGKQYMETSISRGYWKNGASDPSYEPKRTIKMYKGYATVDEPGLRKNSPMIRTYYLKDETSGVWKIDFSRAINAMDQVIRDYAKLERVPDHQAVLWWIEEDIGAEVPATVWDPPK